MSRHVRLAGSFCALITMLLAPAAIAKPVTNYTHYLIAGESAEGIYRAMLRRGPHVGGAKAYASTRMEPTISAQTVEGTNSCRIGQFKINMTFTIQLPQLRKSANVNPTLRKSFNRFYEFAKKHEETHRAIWLKCAAEAEGKVTRVVAKTCSDAEAQGLKIVESIASKCDARHLAFDAAEQKRLVNHPFIKQVLRKGRVIASLPAVGSRKTRAFETN
jgi:predicted secreted Zn-dependent protease